jgi:methionyl-tRNA formyltransferase
MIEDVLEDIGNGKTLHPEIQDNAASNYAPMLEKEEGKIDWTGSAKEIDLKVRAFTPWPGCYTVDGNGKRIKILSGLPVSEKSTQPAGTILSAEGDMACNDGVYRVTVLQPENSKPMDFKSAINGKKISVGQRWGA